METFTEKSRDPHDYEVAAMPMGVMPKTFADGVEVGLHQHQRGQLIYATSGLMKVSNASGIWLVPPQHALWMPARESHQMRTYGQVNMCTFFVREDVIPADFPVTARIIRVSAFLRALLLRAAAIPVIYAARSHESRILDLLLEEINWQRDSVDDLCLRAARDKRLAAVCHAIMAQPGDARTLEQWAESANLSSRTLARLFHNEFGISFTYWRQQVRVLAAMPRLASGEAITTIALDLGYDTPSAFARVFKHVMGVVPSAYFL